MNIEFERLMSQLLELAKSNPDSMFKIIPTKDKSQWQVEFTKGGYWWCVIPDNDDETLFDVAKETLLYFATLTDQSMMDTIQKEWRDAK